jgi:hypothetical protein
MIGRRTQISLHYVGPIVATATAARQLGPPRADAIAGLLSRFHAGRLIDPGGSLPVKLAFLKISTALIRSRMSRGGLFFVLIRDGEAADAFGIDTRLKAAWRRIRKVRLCLASTSSFAKKPLIRGA